MTLGVVSDTHGLLRPELLTVFPRLDHILHAGDIGDPSILAALAQLAPVTAIRGNVDRTGPCAELPPEQYLTFNAVNLYLLHDVHTLSLDPQAAGLSAVIFGHSHKPLLERRRGVLFFNPGAAGPRRFSLPLTVGLLHLDGTSIQAEHLPLL